MSSAGLKSVVHPWDARLEKMNHEARALPYAAAMRLLPILVVLAACGGTVPHPEAAETPVPIHVTGAVGFATRSPTPAGASRALGRSAAPRVIVRAVGPNGSVLGSALTENDGAFAFDALSSAVSLEVVAHVDDDGHDLMVTTDSDGLVPHVGRVPFDAAADVPVAIEFSDDTPMAGALHILEAMLRGSRAVRTWTGRHLPPFFAYWDRGVTTNWSFYSGERGDTGRFTIELLGGEPGQQNSTDTDEHDEGIILHEFGHFVFDQLSSSSSHGGSHPRGVLIDPGLAWEEGRATWFGTTVLGTGWYQDTIGLEPNGELRVHHDVERGLPPDIHGLGSEAGVSEILWDLADGGEFGAADRDNDGVNLGPGGVLEAMIEMAALPGAFPTISSFLRFLIDTGRITEAQLRHLLLLGGHPLDLAEAPAWPMTLEIGTTVAGKIDGLSNPAPSGGPNRPSNGMDAVHVYRFHQPEDGRVTLSLTINGSGLGAQHQDLDLELRDIRSDMIQASQGETPSEVISAELEAGYYIVYVRDGGGQGNRADYSLRTSR